MPHALRLSQTVQHAPACRLPQTTLANGEVAPDLTLVRDRSEMLLRKEQISNGTSPENSLVPQPDR